MAPETATAGLITIETPAVPAIVAEMGPLVTAARAFEVRDLDGNTMALQRCKALRDAERRITDLFEDSRKKADAAKKSILALHDGFIAPIAEARSIYDRKAFDYEAAERRRAEDEQRRLQEVARKAEEERALLAAIEAEEAGDTQEAEAILAEPVVAPVVIVAPSIAKVSGVATREIWSAEIVDVAACLLAMTQRQEWSAALDRLKPELESIFRPLAVAQHEALNFPGVKAVKRQAAR